MKKGLKSYHYKTFKQIKMENGKQPISPLQHKGIPSHESVINLEYMIGLTKREEFARSAMIGLLSNAYVRECLSGNNGMQVPNSVAEYSVQYADALLTKLEDQKDPEDIRVMFQWCYNFILKKEAGEERLKLLEELQKFGAE